MQIPKRCPVLILSTAYEGSGVAPVSDDTAKSGVRTSARASADCLISALHAYLTAGHANGLSRDMWRICEPDISPFPWMRSSDMLTPAIRIPDSMSCCRPNLCMPHKYKVDLDMCCKAAWKLIPQARQVQTWTYYKRTYSKCNCEPAPQAATSTRQALSRDRTPTCSSRWLQRVSAHSLPRRNQGYKYRKVILI